MLAQDGEDSEAAVRIRTIKPEFFTHEGIFEAEKESSLPLRIAFIGLWCAADREGRFKWEPRRLGIQILPYDEIDFSRVLDALTTRGFVVKYESQGMFFGYIPSFTKHQVINNRESDSSIPNPLIENGVDACPTRATRVDHGCKGEGKGKEGKGRDTSPARDGFEEFWKEYPRKVGRQDALKAWNKCKTLPEIESLLAIVRSWKSSPEWQKDAGQFIPHAATWLNGNRWEDEVPNGRHVPAASYGGIPVINEKDWAEGAEGYTDEDFVFRKDETA